MCCAEETGSDGAGGGGRLFFAVVALLLPTKDEYCSLLPLRCLLRITVRRERIVYYYRRKPFQLHSTVTLNIYMMIEIVTRIICIPGLDCCLFSSDRPQPTAMDWATVARVRKERKEKDPWRSKSDEKKNLFFLARFKKNRNLFCQSKVKDNLHAMQIRQNFSARPCLQFRAVLSTRLGTWQNPFSRSAAP